MGGFIDSKGWRWEWSLVGRLLSLTRAGFEVRKKHGQDHV